MPKAIKASALYGTHSRKTSLSAMLCLGLMALPCAAVAEDLTVSLLPDGGEATSSETAKSDLMAMLAKREQLGDTSAIVKPARFVSASDLLSSPVAEVDAKSGDRERPLMGTFSVPVVGRVSVVSQEINADGGVEGVNFFSVDNPDSKWEMDVDVDDGAVFEFTRKWFGSSKQPFKASDKSKVDLLAGN